MNSITKRWVRGSLLITIVVLLMAEAVFLYFSITNYYEGARRALSSRSSTILTQLSASGSQTGESRENVLRRMVEQFSEKDKFELMLVDNSGRVAVSTTGFSRETVAGNDLVKALSSEDGTGYSVYQSEMGEKVMAMTALLPYPSGDLLAIRLVTSLALVDRSIETMVVISLALVTAIILFSVWSGMFFIRSIVRPLNEIEATAAKIALGDLSIRLEQKSDDEIGKLSAAINHMAGELDKNERMKNDFISSVSHELRTPLTSIKGWVETIAAVEDPKDPVYKRGVQVIAEETDRLYAMVEELLDFSRMQNGLTLKPQLLDLAAELTDAAIMVERRVELEGLRLVWEEPAQPVPVSGDPARLRQVFINVLDNAIKYSPKGGVITIELLTDASNAYVSIMDQGPGISPEDLENVRIKFYKGKGAVRGSGIGLAVVDEIMQAHGGALDIQSEVGHGTTVTLRLPIYHREKETEEGKGTSI